jgi:hypothetical protein
MNCLTANVRGQGASGSEKVFLLQTFIRHLCAKVFLLHESDVVMSARPTRTTSNTSHYVLCFTFYVSDLVNP